MVADHREVTMSQTVGVVGLGNAGAAISKGLDGCFELVGHDVDPARREFVAGTGLRFLASVGEVADAADSVLLSLPRPEISLAVVDEILARDRPPAVVIETSTITPKVARVLGERCAGAAVGFVDAAIAGGVQAMAAGRNTFLVGGTDTDLALARTVLDPIAERLRHLGPVGAGSGAKVVHNAVMHALMVVLVEAGAMASKLEIALPTLVEILARPDGLMRPLDHRLAERIARGDYRAGMSVTNARKDSVLALETAQDLGVPLFATLAAHTPYEIAEQQGLGDLDYAALAKLWEQWCGVTLGET